MLAVLSTVAIACGGCTDVASYMAAKTTELGLPVPPAFERTPPQITLRQGGPSGELLTGNAPLLLPDEVVDKVVSEGLRKWLTPAERRLLAEASQHAAVAVTGTPTPWQAVDTSGAVTAAGAAIPVNNVFRSVSGRICRDVRQYLEKGDDRQQRLVTLCREYHGDDLATWVVGSSARAADQ